MILSGPGIISHVASGAITIDPFDPAQVNPNSYNYRLGQTLRVFADEEVDSAATPATTLVEIPKGGLVLQPGRLYLGTTIERIGSNEFVPSLIGRSSLGRLGVFLQIAADLGQLGAIHRWTLELVVAQPIRLYANMIVGQVSFWSPVGTKTHYDGYLGAFSDPALPSPDWTGLSLHGRRT
jgi:dCTP deaminase